MHDDLATIQNKLKARISNPGGPADTDVVDFLAQIAGEFYPMRIFVIDIDKLECTVIGNRKPYLFGARTRGNPWGWQIKGCGFTPKLQIAILMLLEIMHKKL